MSGQQPSAQRRSADRTSTRTAVVWSALQSVLEGAAQAPLRVLDIGGGTGGFAVGVAELGHQVQVIDPSPDALAALDRRAQERGVADRISSQQGDASTLADAVEPASVDLVLCHGVLEYVADPTDALAAIGSVLRSGGRLSLLVGQRHAAVIGKAMAGHFQQARGLLVGESGSTSRTGRRFTHEEATGLLTSAGFSVASVHGIRIFADLVPGSLVDAEPGSATALVELEQAAAELPEYFPLAAQLHLLAHR